jgi:hypothetical protein
MSTSTDADRAAGIRDALRALLPLDGDPQITAIAQQLKAVGEAPATEDRETMIAKAMVNCDRIAKSEDLPSATREQARKAGLALQREHLAKTNPAAADEWQRTWGVHHGVTV